MTSREDSTQSKPPKTKVKVYGVLILLIVICGVFGYGYYQYTKVVDLKDRAEKVTHKAERYDTITRELQAEKNRCQEFISQKQGNFGSFEYCQQFIDWTENKELLLDNTSSTSQ